MVARSFFSLNVAPNDSPGSHMRNRIAIAADALRQDVGYAARGFLRSPAFTATVVLSILIGVAGT